MKKIMEYISATVAPVLTWLFPVIFMYARNVKEVGILEAVSPAGVFLLCAAVCCLIGLVLFRNWKQGAFFSAISGLFLTNFTFFLDFLQNLMPTIRYWHLLYIAVLLAIAVCWLVGKYKFLDDGLFISKIVFGGLILFNLVTAAPTIIQKISDASQKQVEMDVSIEHQSGNRNIYYILCDEYASFAQLEQDFHYDNSAFRDELKSLGFNVSETSRNDTFQTVVVMANVMQLDYIATEKSTSVELENLTTNGNLHQILRENGYQMRGIGKTEWLGFEGTVSASGATTDDGASLNSVVLDRSFFKPFVARNYIEEAQQKYDTLVAMKNMEIVPNSSMFTMCYITIPHHPYFFDEDGNMTDPDKWANDETGKNNDAYIGMVKFINKHLIEIVERIITEDPNAVILLGSDHGNRYGPVAEENKCRILNTLYFGGEVIDELEGLSTVNTMRMIFNRVFGTEMEYINLPA